MLSIRVSSQDVSWSLSRKKHTNTYNNSSADSKSFYLATVPGDWYGDCHDVAQEWSNICANILTPGMQNWQLADDEMGRLKNHLDLIGITNINKYIYMYILYINIYPWLIEVIFLRWFALNPQTWFIIKYLNESCFDSHHFWLVASHVQLASPFLSFQPAKFCWSEHHCVCLFSPFLENTCDLHSRPPHSIVFECEIPVFVTPSAAQSLLGTPSRCPKQME